MFQFAEYRVVLCVNSTQKYGYLAKKQKRQGFSLQWRGVFGTIFLASFDIRRLERNQRPLLWRKLFQPVAGDRGAEPDVEVFPLLFEHLVSQIEHLDVGLDAQKSAQIGQIIEERG